MRTPYTATSYREAETRAIEECTGYVVCDPRRRKIGRAESFFLNGSGEPEYIRVKTGLFGLKKVLIPVQSVAVDKEQRALVLQ
jgi:hypothetical protein